MNPNVRQWLAAESKALMKVREELNLDMPLQQWHLLCTIGAEPGIGSRDLKMNLKLTPASLSRHIKALSTYGEKDKKTGKEKLAGYGFIDPRVDPYERRNLIYYLTPEGETFLTDVYEIIFKILETTEA